MRCPRLSRRFVLALCLGLPLLWAAVSAVAAWRFARRAQPVVPEPAPPLAATPIEELRLRTEDGLELGAWLAGDPDAPLAVVLLHANAGSRSARFPEMLWLLRRGFLVLAPSLRAHGDSGGDWNDWGWSARLDVLAATAELERRRPGRRLLLAGESLGGVAAIFAAAELGPRAAGYWLEAPYLDLNTAVRNRTSIYLPPVLDRVAYAGLSLWARPFLGVDPDLVSPLERIGDIPASLPVRLLSGTEDDRAPLADVRRLAERAGPHAKVVEFPGAVHESLFHRDRARFEEAFDAFTAQCTVAQGMR